MLVWQDPVPAVDHALVDEHDVAALKSTGRDWQPMALDFEVTADCGLGLALMLQTQAPFEARTGLRGEAVFDDLRLERLPETPVLSTKAPT